MQNTAVAQNGKQNSQVRGSNGSNTNKNRSSTHNYRHNNSINEGNNRKSSSANFQGSERQRMLYIERYGFKFRLLHLSIKLPHQKLSINISNSGRGVSIPNRPPIRSSSSAHLLLVRSNYMDWKSLRPHFNTAVF